MSSNINIYSTDILKQCNAWCMPKTQRVFIKKWELDWTYYNATSVESEPVQQLRTINACLFFLWFIDIGLLGGWEAVFPAFRHSSQFPKSQIWHLQIFPRQLYLQWQGMLKQSVLRLERAEPENGDIVGKKKLLSSVTEMFDSMDPINVSVREFLIICCYIYNLIHIQIIIQNKVKIQTEKKEKQDKNWMLRPDFHHFNMSSLYFLTLNFMCHLVLQHIFWPKSRLIPRWLKQTRTHFLQEEWSPSGAGDYSTHTW